MARPLPCLARLYHLSSKNPCYLPGLFFTGITTHKTNKEFLLNFKDQDPSLTTLIHSALVVKWLWPLTASQSINMQTRTWPISTIWISAWPIIVYCRYTVYVFHMTKTLTNTRCFYHSTPHYYCLTKHQEPITRSAQLPY